MVRHLWYDEAYMKDRWTIVHPDTNQKNNLTMYTLVDTRQGFPRGGEYRTILLFHSKKDAETYRKESNLPRGAISVRIEMKLKIVP